jgi:hypothetical protein
MRLAYDNYREASETLDAVASQGPIDNWSWDRIRGIESVAAKQRIEFERYIEKRLQYSEFVRDRSNLPADDWTAPNQRQGGRGLWLGRVASRAAVVAALLCTMFFMLHERRRIRDADVARDEMSAAENRAVVQPWNRITTETTGSRPTGVATAITRKFEEPIRVPKAGGRSYYRFTLTPSTQFKQVGTVGLSLRKDPRQRYFDLHVTFENSKVEKKHVKLDEPVWINAADRIQAVAVVLTRIQKNSVQGYLSEPSHRRPETTARIKLDQRSRGRS